MKIENKMLTEFSQSKKFPRGGMCVSQEDRIEFNTKTVKKKAKEEEEDEDIGNLIVATESFLEGV